MNDDDNTAEVLADLRRSIAEAGSVAAWVRIHGFTPQFIGDVLHGRRNVTENLGRALGWERVVTWRKKEGNASGSGCRVAAKDGRKWRRELTE